MKKDMYFGCTSDVCFHPLFPSSCSSSDNIFDNGYQDECHSGHCVASASLPYCDITTVDPNLSISSDPRPFNPIMMSPASEPYLDPVNVISMSNVSERTPQDGPVRRMLSECNYPNTAGPIGDTFSSIQ